MKKAKLNGTPLSLIIFDLDHFKKLNDNYGHDAGDYVLKEMADLVKNNGVREQDVFARYGGEEFVILLPKTNLKYSFEIAERLRKLIEAHSFTYESQKLPVTAVSVLPTIAKAYTQELTCLKERTTQCTNLKKMEETKFNFTER